MAQDRKKVPTAIGASIGSQDLRAHELDAKLGQPPVVLQVQSHAFIALEQPEQLRQFESDLRSFYGVDIDASQLAGHACETCSCGRSDDCGFN